ncbi:MAG: hypothetical protein ACRELC_10570 [Gemmatimonadota bacterium]
MNSICRAVAPRSGLLLVAAAVRTADGRVFWGPTHPDALDAAVVVGASPETALEQSPHEAGVERGYVDEAGEYVDENEIELTDGYPGMFEGAPAGSGSLGRIDTSRVRPCAAGSSLAASTHMCQRAV